LLVEVQYTLHIKQTLIIFNLCIYDYTIKQRILGGFLKLNSSNHPTAMTLKPGAADGIGTVMQGFESRPTPGGIWAASRQCPDGSGRLLVGPLKCTLHKALGW